MSNSCLPDLKIFFTFCKVVTYFLRISLSVDLYSLSRLLICKIFIVIVIYIEQ